MKHKLLTTATLLLFVLLTWSCTNDDELAMTPPPAIATPDASALSITIAPRPAYAPGIATRASSAPGSASPATRAVQTPEATQWETGDVIWLYVNFSWTPAEAPAPETKDYVSALRYDGTAWLPLTVQDSLDLNTSGIVPYTDVDRQVSHSGFIRHLRWPSAALAGGVTGAKATVKAYYLGGGIPVDGVIDIDDQTDFMYARVNTYIATPVTLNLSHKNTRLHVTDRCTLKLDVMNSLIQWNLVENDWSVSTVADINVPLGGGYYMVGIIPESVLTLDGITYTLTPGYIDGAGSKRYDGYTYTLIPLKNGTVTPGE